MPYPKPNIKNQQSPQKYFHYSYGILHDSFETYFFAKYKESEIMKNVGTAHVVMGCTVS